jgi:hypothetical protein
MLPQICLQGTLEDRGRQQVHVSIRVGQTGSGAGTERACSCDRDEVGYKDPDVLTPEGKR